MVPRNSSLVGRFAYICQSHLVIKKSTNSLFKIEHALTPLLALGSGTIPDPMKLIPEGGFCSHTVIIIIVIIIIIIIFNIYIVQINIQEYMIKCALHIEIEYEITMLPIYNFEFTIKCEGVYYMKH